jgi:hypothetical protein
MPMLTLKSRTISLRLSQNEFEALKSLYTAHGARSISDFVRTSIQRVISEAAPTGDGLELKVQELDGKLSILDGEVRRLSRLLEGELLARPGKLP